MAKKLEIVIIEANQPSKQAIRDFTKHFHKFTHQMTAKENNFIAPLKTSNNTH